MSAIINPHLLDSGGISWTAKVGVSEAVPGVIVSTAAGWGNAGAFSVESVNIIQFICDSTTHSRICGQSRTNPNASYTSIEYGILMQTNVFVFESGVLRFSGSALSPGDILRVEHVGTTMVYKHNGVTIRTATSVPTGTYFADAAIETLGAKIGPVTFS